MIKMKISPAEALKHLKLIELATCRKGISTRWQVKKDKNGDDFVPAQSVCWLYCWAKTGRNSEKAREQARNAFDSIFDQPFDRLERRLDHQRARAWRYDEGNIEKYFYSHIGGKSRMNS